MERADLGAQAASPIFAGKFNKPEMTPQPARLAQPFKFLSFVSNEAQVTRE